MICIGVKTNGEKCGSKARVDFLTCKAHRDQEPGVKNLPGETGAAAPISVGASTSKAATFASCSDNYRIVVRPRRTQVLNGNTETVDVGLSAQFTNGRFSTTNPELIAALRGHERLGTRFLQEVV